MEGDSGILRASIDLRGHCEGMCMCNKGREMKEGQMNLIQEGKRDGEMGRVRVETSADRGGFLRAWRSLIRIAGSIRIAPSMTTLIGVVGSILKSRIQYADKILCYT